MKQHITKEQWEELKDEEMDVIRRFVGWNKSRLLNIGQMIEFLEDNWWEHIEARYYNDNDFILCNVLWEAVKYKLTN